MSRQILSKEEKIEVKRERIPVHESRNKLKFRGLDHDNFHYRMVNVTKGPDHISRFTNAGYQFVTKDPSGSPTKLHVDSFDGVSSIITEGGGKGITLALMAIPKEFYDADQEAKAAKILEQENEMRRDLEEKTDRSQGNYGKVEFFGSMFGRPMGPRPPGTKV